MKKIIYSIAVFLTSIGITRNAYAMWPDLTPLIPLAPQFCAMCTPSAVMTALSYAQQVKAIKDDLTKFTDMSQLKQMATSYLPKMGATALNAARKKPAAKKKVISFSRTIEECTVADIKDPNSVKDAFIKLFMQYPSKKNSVKSAYAEMGEQLKMDTTLEMFITAKEMEKELLGKEPGKDIKPTAQNLADLGILKQIDLIESCLVEGKNCDVIGLDACVESKKGSKSEEGQENDEDNVCYWNSALQAEKFYDAVMRYNEFLVSMHAQYQAVLGIEKLAKIREKGDTENDGSSNNNNNNSSSLQIVPQTQDYASGIIFADMAFADMTDADKQAEDDLRDYNNALSTHENVLGGEFEETGEAAGYESPLDGREDDLESAALLAEVQDDLNKAMRVHNLKQLLPDYRRVYKDYNTAKKQHELALENVAISGECITRMLEPYYSNAAVAWHGNDCRYLEKGKLICHYKPEQTFDENNAENEGDLNTACPGDEGHKCYIISLDEAQTKAKGISGYLTTLYAKAKDMEATADTDSYINAQTEEGRADANVARTTITSDFNQEEGEDIYVADRDQDEKDNGDSQLGLLHQAVSQEDGHADDESSAHLKNQRQGDEEKENARKDGILRWVLGSLAAKEVAIDLGTGADNFGNRKGNFPLWTDQKIFYDQYIDGKYDNIKEYIETLPVSEIVLNMAGTFNEIYPYQDKIKNGVVVKTAEELRTKNGKDIAKAQNASKPLGSDEDALIEAKLAEEDALFANITNKYNNDIAAIKAQIERKYDELDRNNAALDEKNQKYNENNSVIKAADATSAEANAAVEYGDSLYADRELTEDAPQNTKDQSDPEVIGFKTKDNRNDAEKSEAVTKKAEAADTAAEEARAKALDEEIKELKKQIEARRIQYVKDLSDAEIAAHESFKTFSEELKAARVINNSISNSLTAISPVGLAAQVAECVRTYAIKEVAEAKSKLDAMKNNGELYSREYAEKVHTIHTDMIDKITEIDLEELAESCPVIAQLQEMAKTFQDKQLEENPNQEPDDPLDVITEILNILNKTCDDVECKESDNEYFVGAIGLPRDMKAPNQATEFASIPLREIFHFDVYDYNNLAKYYDGDINDVKSNLDLYTSAVNVLEYLNSDARNGEYGSTVPEIWLKILQRHAFVQKEFDLVDLLSGTEDITNSTRKALSRSGVFPCRVGSHIVDVSLDLDYMVDDTKDANKYYDLPTCQGLIIKEVDGKRVVFDEEVGGGNLNLDPPGFTGNVVRASELGNILAYTPDKDALIKAKLQNPGLTMEDVNALPHRLTFNANLMRAVKTIVETEDVGKEGHEAEDSLFYLASRVMLERNQFGDYLDQLENESIKADELQKFEKQIYDIRTSLLEVFADTGFELGEDFDLTDEEDYAQAESTLNSQKDIYVNQSINKLGQVKGTTQMVADKLSKLLTKISILSLDSDEVVAITGEETESELREKIDESKANNAVGEEYTKEKEKETERRLERYRRPYCAVYPK